MKREFLILAAFLILGMSLPTLGQSGKDLEAEMQSQLQGKIVFVRGFYRGEHLRYDSKGTIRGTPEKGVWSLDGRMEIKKVRVGKHECTLEGETVATIFDLKKKEMHFARVHPMEIEVALEEPEPRGGLIAAFERIFMKPDEKFTDMVPAYWRFFLEHPFEAKPPAGRDPSGASISEPEKPKSGWKEAAPMGVPEARPGSQEAHEPDYYTVDGTPVFRAVGQSTPLFYSLSKKTAHQLTPPKVIKSPDPEYPENLRKHKLQGTTVLWAIVGEDGRIKELQVMRPQGLGFDDSAAEAVQKWTFQPAKLNGKPVPVAINIEVNYRLY